MKLVFFIDNTRVIGGGEYAQFHFAAALAKRGHQVVVFAGDKNEFTKELESVDNLLIRHRLTIPILIRGVGFGKLNALWENIHFLLVISPFIKSFQPDWLIGYLRKSAIKAARLGKKQSIPVANFVFESLPWLKKELGKQWFSEWKSRSFRESWKKTKLAYASSTVLIPNSFLSGKYMKSWLPKVTISKPVYPGVALEKVRSTTTKKKYDIVYHGRLNNLKNINELLLACTHTKKRRSILIIGDGEERPALERQAKALGLTVTFTGFVSDEEKWKLLAQSKLLVFPTSFEGFGMPPMDSLAAGSQVLCSDIPILREVYGGHVHYFPLHDTKRLAAKIDGILDNSIKSKRVPKNFLKKYTWENAAITIEEVLGK